MADTAGSGCGEDIPLHASCGQFHQGDQSVIEPLAELRDRLRVRHYARSTEKSYLYWFGRLRHLYRTTLSSNKCR